MKLLLKQLAPSILMLNGKCKNILRNGAIIKQLAPFISMKNEK
jgi:hypothetical protein